MIFMGILAAGLAFGGYKVWSGFTDSYRHEGAMAQLEADKPLIDKANAIAEAQSKRAENAEVDAAKAVAAAAEQSAAIAAASEVAGRAVEAARTQAIKYAEEVAKREQRLAQLRKAAAATPEGGQSCEAVLAATDAILRESARARQ